MKNVRIRIIKNPNKKIEKKVAIAIVIIIILISSAILVGIGWLIREKSHERFAQKNLQTKKTLNKEQLSTLRNNLCKQNSIKEYGRIDTSKDILIYETTCVLKTYPDNTTDSLVRYYVRDSGGIFNIKIYSVLNKSNFHGGTYGEIKGFRNDKLVIHRVKSGDDKEVVDVYGNISDLTKEELTDDYIVSLSPNKNFIIKIGYPDAVETSTVKAGQVQIENIKNGDLQTYDFEQRLDGVYVAGWTSDGNSVFIAGGIWEFAAPAKLWKIDMPNKTIKEYKNLKGLVYPVYVFPEENIAFARSADGFDKEKKFNIKLYQLDLNNGFKKIVANENAISTFEDIKKIGNSLFYLTSNEGVDRQLEKFDLDTGKISKVLDGPISIEEYLPSGQLVLQNNKEYFILYTDSDTKKLIGDGNEIGTRIPPNGKEYVSEIVGWVKKR